MRKLVLTAVPVALAAALASFAPRPWLPTAESGVDLSTLLGADTLAIALPTASQPRCQLRASPTAENLCEVRVGKFGLSGPVATVSHVGEKQAIDRQFLAIFGLTDAARLSGGDTGRPVAGAQADDAVTGSIKAAR